MAAKIGRHLKDIAFSGVPEAIAYAKPLANVMLLNRILDDTLPLVPWRTGALAETGTILYSQNSIRFTSEYAPYAFEPIAPSGKRKEYYTMINSDAGGMPLERASDLYKREWADFYVEKVSLYADHWLSTHVERLHSDIE